MAIELSEFWSRLSRVGIADEKRRSELAGRFGAATGSAEPDPGSLAAFLVKSDVITPFQAKTLLAKPEPALRLGNYVVRNPKAPSPLTRFTQVQRLGTSHPDTQRLDDQHLGSQSIGVMIRTKQRTTRLSKHAAVKHPNLQPLELDSIGKHDIVFSAIGKGKPLIESLETHSWNSRSIALFGKKIASALAQLHQHDLVHGAVRADRIWVRTDGEPILLRDPSEPAGGEDSDLDAEKKIVHETDAWLATTESPLTYVAPELFHHDRKSAGKSGFDASRSSPSSDIYSLGCLLFRMSTGRLPFGGDDAETFFQAHASAVPAELEEALRLGEQGNPLFRVLAYAMAKSPQSRFASASDLETALAAAIKTFPAPKPVEQKSPVRKPLAEPAVATAASPSPVSKPVVTTQKPELVESKPDRITPIPDTIASDTGNQSPRRARRKRKNKAPWVLAGLAGIVVLQTLTLIFTDPVQPVVRSRAPFVPPAVVPSVSRRTESASDGLAGDGLAGDGLAGKKKSPVRSATVADNRAGSAYQVSDDNQSLYLSPRQSKAMASDSADAVVPSIPLDLLPPGPAMIVSARLSSIQSSLIGQSVLDAFAPELTSIVDAMFTRIAIPSGQVSRVTLAIYPDPKTDLQVSLSVTLSEATSLETLLEAWQVSQARTRDGHTIYAGDLPGADAFYLPADQVAAKQIQRFTVGSMDAITELASIQGEPIPLPRSLRSLWNTTDAETKICVLSLSNFLFADGRSLLQNSVPEAVDPLRRVLIPDTSAVLWVADWDETGDVLAPVYSEVRFFAAGGITPVSLAQSLAKSFKGLPGWASDFATDAKPDDRWRPLFDRLPGMIQYAADRVRVGLDQNTAVANVYLPAVAVPQLSLGTVLAMNTPPSDAGSIDSAAMESLTVAEILERPMSVSFGQESLEFAIEAIVDSLGQQLPSGTKVPEIKIIGGDLQLMGITQNQQIRNFDKQDLPLRQVLTDLVVAANPDKSAVGPSDPKQSLIWVVTDPNDTSTAAESGGGSNKQASRILVTTRQAAQTNPYDLPSEFVP